MTSFYLKELDFSATLEIGIDFGTRGKRFRLSKMTAFPILFDYGFGPTYDPPLLTIRPRSRKIEQEEYSSKYTSVSPNPTSSEFVVRISNLPKVNVSRLEIYTFDGKMVQNSNGNGPSLEVSTIDLLDGLYVVKIILSNGMIENHHLIVTH